MYERKPAIPGVEQAGRSVPRVPPSYGRLVVLLLALLVAAGGAAYWWTHRAPPIPAGIAWSNGRLEEDEIDIQTKLAARIAAIMVDEGDTVHAGQVLATMDVRDLQAQLEKAKADQMAAEQVIAQAQADLVTAQSAAALAQREVARTQSLVPQGFATQELLEQRQDAVNATQSALHAITARIAAATAARDSAKHTAESIKINIDDATLVAPHDGVILYRFANVGEVLGAGGKIYTMLDTSYVYMDVFLPTREAGQAMPGSEARILLELAPRQADRRARRLRRRPEPVHAEDGRDPHRARQPDVPRAAARRSVGAGRRRQAQRRPAGRGFRAPGSERALAGQRAAVVGARGRERRRAHRRRAPLQGRPCA